MRSKRVIVLGSTGSIGTSALEVIRRLPDCFQVVGLACHKNVDLLCEQFQEFRPQAVAVSGPEGFRGPAADSTLARTRRYEGEEGLLALVRELEAEVVVNGISGSSGLLPSLAALESGKDLALANKESLVMAGPLLLRTARERKARLIPVDSEHFALFSLLEGIRPEAVDELILTASGGAFRDLPYERLSEVGVKDALKHPNWEMGVKITLDSATLANKGLELIEAHHLFGVASDRLKVVIHPQSLVHSMVRTVGGFIHAQISEPDMRIVIQNALSWPDPSPSAFTATDLMGKEMGFYPVDEHKYRLLGLAYRVLEGGEAQPIVYNAANEVALDRFLDEAIGFLEIADVVEETLKRGWDMPAGSLEEILTIDRLARERARAISSLRESRVV